MPHVLLPVLSVRPLKIELLVTFWAHSDPTGLAPESPGAHWQPLAEHLRNVAALACSLAEGGAPHWEHFQQLPYWAGLLHDYGKYTDCFQNMIRTGKGRCPDAIHGVSMAFQSLRAAHISLAIEGHHAGIPDHGELGIARRRLGRRRWSF